MSCNTSQKGSSETHICSSGQGKQLVSEILINCDVYSSSSAKTRSRPGSYWCFRKSSPRRNCFLEVLNTWLGRKDGGHVGKRDWCPWVSGVYKRPHCLSMHISVPHFWDSEWSEPKTLIKLPFNKSSSTYTGAGAPSFSQGCSGMLSITLLALPEQKGLKLFIGTACQSLLQIL